MTERMGFFTDTSICIGCKACEVACKEWNDVPDDGFVFRATSYDNTGSLGANTWRHVAFIEQPRRTPGWEERTGAEGGEGQEGRDGREGRDGIEGWLMSSDVCKHCTHAA